MKHEYIMYRDLVESGLIERHNDLKYTMIQTPEARKRKRQSCLYVFCGYFPGYTKPLKKIGISCDVEFRHKAVQRNCPYPVFIDYVFPNPFCKQLELSLHHKFKNERLKNPFCKSGETEWFIGLDDVDIISELILIDFTSSKHMSYECKFNEVDYSFNFRPSIYHYFSDNISYKQIVSGIEVEQKFGDVELLVDVLTDCKIPV